MNRYRIGIDLGGTKIEGVLLDPELKILARERKATVQQDGYEAIVERIAALIRQLQGLAPESCSVGICTPGSLSQQTGLLRNSNTLCLNGKPLQSDLEKELGHSLKMENDANCFVLAEGLMGAARGLETVFGVIMGTGVGGGVLVHGKLHTGRLHIAGEWGHHILHPGGNPCYCGRRGCVETYLSGPALERRWLQCTGDKMKLAEIVQVAENESGNEAVRRWLDEFMDDFGIALGNVINILDPDVIVLGGGVSNIPFLYSRGREAVQQNIFCDVRDTPIVQNQMGDSAGVLGAACL